MKKKVIFLTLAAVFFLGAAASAHSLSISYTDKLIHAEVPLYITDHRHHIVIPPIPPARLAPVRVGVHVGSRPAPAPRHPPVAVHHRGGPHGGPAHSPKPHGGPHRKSSGSINIGLHLDL